MRSHLKSLTAAGLVLSALALSACDDKDAAQQAAAPQAPEVAVVTVNPQKVTLTTELVGRTSAYMVSEVRPQVSGIIQKRLFNEGGRVKAGESLYVIDPAPYEADYTAAKAELARAEANTATARARAKRFSDLVSLEAVSRQEYDDAVAALKEAEAAIMAGKASVQRAEINLRYTKVVSPISGRIGRSLVTPGALVTANQPEPIATVQQLDPIYVDVTQSSAELSRLKRSIDSGQVKSAKKAADTKAKVRLVLEDGTPYPLEGTIEFADVTVDPSTGSVVIRAIFPNPNNDLLPGMYVRAILGEGVLEDALLAPQQAVSRDPMGNATTLVVGKDGMVQQRTVVADRSINGKWLVSEGLQAGDRVIVEGLQRIIPGAPVSPVELEATTGAVPSMKAQQ